MLKSRFAWLLKYEFTFILLFSAADPVSGFPSNIRYGYSTCQTCHVSPTGGGVVSKYGKMTSEEFMSTWARPGEASPLYGVVRLPHWIDIGGDARQVEIGKYTDQSDFKLKFQMQSVQQM